MHGTVLTCCLLVQDQDYDLLAEQQEGEVQHGDGDATMGEAGQPNGIHEGEQAGGDAAAAPAGQANKVRVTTPYLTKYERARILGTRALQIRCVRSVSG